MTVHQLLTAAALLPLLGAFAGLTARWWRPGRNDRLPALAGVAAVAGSFALCAAAAVNWDGATLTGAYYTVLDRPGLRLELGYLVDSLTLTLCGLVTLVALCVSVFALGYLADELTPEYRDHHSENVVRPGRLHLFYGYLCLFCSAMLLLALGGNLFHVFCGWELVGACSYLLIGFYYEREYAGAAATKAFVVNRVGDAGFLIGLAALLAATGDVRFGSLFAAADAGAIPRTALLIGGFGVLAGCVGKSAQFPLQVWLPDAMAGPTPVSALVHSATMVAAGVYLLGRTLPMLPGEVLLTAAYLGAATLVIGATAALFQTDIKAVLAYSTVSQLGYMLLALGVTGWGAGLFHLVTHAFFKGLMFLCAGSVIVACRHVQDVTKLGGLLRKMPATGGAMLVGVLAISGLAVPGVTVFGDAVSFSGFHSKDAILTHARAFADLNPSHAALFWVAVGGAGLTALYMVRLWILTFAGKPREASGDATESPTVMVGPILVLAGLAAFCALGGESGPLYGFLSRSEPPAATSPRFLTPNEAEIEHAHPFAATAGLLAAGAGALAGILLYGLRFEVPGFGRTEAVRRTAAGRWLAAGWGFDALYRVAVLKPAAALAVASGAADRTVLDRAVHGAAALTRGVANVERAVDDGLVDGLVRATGAVARGTGRAFGATQTGGLRQYVAALTAAAVALGVLAVALLSR